MDDKALTEEIAIMSLKILKARSLLGIAIDERLKKRTPTLELSEVELLERLYEILR